ncbi:STAS-like domain-containing protein [Deinococcus ficus]|uniref:STAS-like domain-containing protein n=1 Tax=Deinococcus ficus TaxID=317577 RepID=UPI00131D91FC|nr:DUF4325 domain-containing protein [Deinococcus ficus]
MSSHSRGRGRNRPNSARYYPKTHGRQRAKFTFNIQQRGKFHIETDDTTDDLVIRVTGILHWNAFCIISASIKKITSSDPRKNIIVDLSQIIIGYQDGILPLIALLDFYRLNDYEVSVRLPKHHESREKFSSHNWSHYLDKNNKKTNRNNPRTSGVLEFNDFESLNNMINKAIQIAIKGGQFKPGTLKALEWSLNEITDNVIRHSGNYHGWLEVIWQADGSIEFTVCDNGIGIPNTMRDAFPDLQDDAAALHRAMEKGVTSNQEGQGNGLAGTLEIVLQSGGSLMINSHRGHLRVEGGRTKAETGCVPYNGTFVHFRIPGIAEVDLAKALWGYEELGYVDLKYDNNETDGIVISLREEENNFGNRATGERIRNLIMNVATDNPGRPITVDFSEIGLVSSSFADEVFGKLALKWGIMNFSRLVKFTNMCGLVDGIINKAIMQRIAQSYQT